MSEAKEVPIDRSAPRTAIRLGRIFGIEIGLDYSWFVILALVTWTLAAHYFPMNYRWPIATYWAIGLVTSLLFFASVLAHELGHSVVALRKGIPVRAITLFLFGGMAEIAKEPARPRDEFWIAIAGPVVSVALGVIFYLLHSSASPDQPLAALTLWLSWINFSLAAFNLIPGFPLDGGRVLRSAVWALTGSFQRATRVASMAGRVIAYGFIALGILIALTGSWMSGLWLVFIGWFLGRAALSSYRQVALRERLAGVTAREIMMTDCPPVPRTLTLSQLVHDYILRDARRCFPVVDGEEVVGVVTLHHVKAVPQEEWATTTVGQAMTPLEQAQQVRPDQDLLEILAAMAEGDLSLLPVFEQGKLLGMIPRDRLLAVLRVRAELGDLRQVVWEGGRQE